MPRIDTRCAGGVERPEAGGGGGSRRRTGRGRRPDRAGPGGAEGAAVVAVVARRVGWSGPGRAAGVACAVGIGRGRRPDRAGPGGRGLDPAVGQVVPLAPGRRFYPSRGIEPLGVGWPRRGCGRGVCRPGGPAVVARRVGWSGPGRAAGVALAVGWGVAADRHGPDRVGSRARRSGAAARIRAGSPLEIGGRPVRAVGSCSPDGAGVVVVWGLVTISY